MKFNHQMNISIAGRRPIASPNTHINKWRLSLKLKILCSLLILLILPLNANSQYTPPQNSNSMGERNLQDILAGRRTLEQFSSIEQAEIMNAYKALHPSPSKKLSKECEDLRDDSKEAAIAISDYSKKLQDCIAYGNYADDCYLEFKRTKNAYSEYESSVSTFKSRCQ